MKIVRQTATVCFALALCISAAFAQVNPGSGPLTIAKGGTNAITPAAARTNLGLAIGSATQAWDADLDCLAALSGTGILRHTGAGTCSSGTVVSVAEGGTGVASLGTGVITALGVNVGSAGAVVVNGGALGTPSSGVGTNITGLPISTGVSGLAANIAAFLATPSSANLRAALTDETGTGIAYFVGGALGTPASGVATSLTGLPLTTGVTGTLPIGNGGTGQTTAATARASSGLNVDQYAAMVNANYTILATDRTVGTTVAFTASRTATLPAANAVNAGQEIVVADFQGTVTGVNTLVITRAGSDTVNGGTSVTITAANGAYLLKSDGTSKWTAQALGAAAAGGVSSVTCGTGLSGGTITTSGTCAASLATAANSLGADVNMGTVNTYVDGPSMAQGSSGTWFASGQVTIFNTTAEEVDCKLWDGSTVNDSAAGNIIAGGRLTIHLSAIFGPPAGNIRITCKGISTATGKMEFNRTGTSKDSTINGFRIQ